jgi:Protein of unknown function (DUF3617)
MMPIRKRNRGKSAMTRSREAGLLIALCLLAASPALAKIRLDPGAWQQVESGTEDGQPAEPVTYTDCLTPAQARDPIKALAGLDALGRLIGRQCRDARFVQKADKVTLSFACGDEKTISIAIDLVFSFHGQRHYTGSVKSTFVLKGKKTTSDKMIEAKWLGPECEKN